MNQRFGGVEWIARTFWVWALTLLTPLTHAAVVRPDAAAARAFGIQLQNDFSTQKSAAVIAQIDTDAFTERVFGTKDVKPRYPWADWHATMPPALTGSMHALDAFPILAYFRVVLERDSRALECEFLTPAGGVQTVTFYLVESGNGVVRIGDMFWGGDLMSKSIMLRHTFILEGVTLPKLRDDEERELDALATYHRSEFGRMLVAFNDGKYEEVLSDLIAFPPEVRQTRICRHYLTCLPLNQKGVAAEIHHRIDQGEYFDPMYRFYFAVAENDQRLISAALDEILAERQRPAVYECIKAGILLSEGDPARAYRLARNMTVLEPRLGLAYVVALQAAVAQQSPDTIAILNEWARVLPAKQIDAWLDQIPRLTAFRSTKPYLDWLQTQAAPEPVPAR